MSSLSSVEARLPPGFRFHPRDEELICDYLMKWVTGSAHPFPLLIQVDLNHCEPWDVPESACVGGKEWYFYSQRDRKYATGLRTNRATVSGYWKATGKDRPVIRKGTLVGMRKTLVFYGGRAPKGRKTDWVMHEFRIEGAHGPGPKTASPVKQEDWVLCRMFFKNSSENPADKSQETGTTSSLPPLMDPYYYNNSNNNNNNSITFDDEQVPCFSIFTQTTPTFSLLAHPPEIFVPNPPDPAAIYVNNSPTSLIMNGTDANYSSYNCDKKAIRAVLNHLTKMDSHDHRSTNLISGSPSFGEGSSDSYLSQVGLSCMWNY